MGELMYQLPLILPEQDGILPVSELSMFSYHILVCDLCTMVKSQDLSEEKLSVSLAEFYWYFGYLCSEFTFWMRDT